MRMGKAHSSSSSGWLLVLEGQLLEQAGFDASELAWSGYVPATGLACPARKQRNPGSFWWKSCIQANWFKRREDSWDSRYGERRRHKIWHCNTTISLLAKLTNKHSQEFNVGRREWAIYPECDCWDYYVYFLAWLSFLFIYEHGKLDYFQCCSSFMHFPL